MPTDVIAVDDGRAHGAELAGLDALEADATHEATALGRFWSALWPKLAAVGLALLVWQIVVWTNWKPTYVLPGPRQVFPRLWDLVRTGSFWRAVATTMRRALTGFALAIVIGTVVGAAVARVRVL